MLGGKKGTLDDNLNSPRIAGALASTVLSSGQVDVADLREYLETGYSPKFEDEKILGFWKTDPSEVMRLLKRENPDMSVDELVAAKELAITVLDGIHLTADAKGSLEVFTIETDTMKRYQERKSQKKGSDPTTLLEQAVEHTFDRAFEDRYGVSMSQGQSNATAGARGADAARQAREAREALEAEKKFRFDGSGSWKQGSGTSMTGTPYSVTVGNQNVDAEVIGGRLFLYPNGGPTLIMNKIVH